MTRLGKRLKKDKINVDIVCFGSEVQDSATLEPLNTLIDTINANADTRWVFKCFIYYCLILFINF